MCSERRQSLQVELLAVSVTKRSLSCTAQLWLTHHCEDTPNFPRQRGSARPGGPFAEALRKPSRIHAFKVAAFARQTPTRDVALLHVLYGTGMIATEVARLEVADVLDEGGEFHRQSGVHVATAIHVA